VNALPFRRWWIGAALLVAVASSAQIVVDPPSWQSPDAVEPGRDAKKLFTVKNKGSSPVHIKELLDTGDCRASLDRTDLAPGESTSLTITASAPYTDDGTATWFDVDVVLIVEEPPQKITIPVRVGSEDTIKLHVSASVPAGKYQPRPGDQPVTVRCFYSGGCSACRNFIRQYLEPLERHFGDAVELEVLDTRERASLEAYYEALRRYQVQNPGSFNAFVGEHALLGSEEIDSKLGPVLLEELQHPTRPPADRPAVRPTAAEQQLGPPAHSEVERQFNRYTVLGVITAGLIDGINPCAFATIVFLIAMLSRLGHDRRTLLLAGLSFAAAVFVTYLLLGLGVARSLEWLSTRGALEKAMRTTVAAVAILCAIGQVVDVLRLERGGPTRELTMQTPHRVKQWIHAVMRAGLSRPSIVVGSLVAGVLITLLEAVCTGQVYLPTIVAVMRQPEYRTRAVGLLLVYNVCFVAPLLAVLGLSFAGVGSDKLAAAARRHLSAVKLVMAVLLAGLAWWLLAGAA
jgi:hypothetical protein